MGQEFGGWAACVGVVVIIIMVRARHEVWFRYGKQPFGLARWMVLLKESDLMWKLMFGSDGFHKGSGQVSWVLVRDIKAGVKRSG